MRLSFSGYLAVLISATLAVACGPDSSDSTHESVVQIAPAFQSYVTEFQQKAASSGLNIQINDLIVEFGPMTSPLERGYCELSTNKTPLIVVDEDYWNSSSDGARKSLLLHELGHCILKRAHLSNLTVSGVPESLMNPYTIPSNVFDYNEAHYWQELFSVINTM